MNFTRVERGTRVPFECFLGGAQTRPILVRLISVRWFSGFDFALSKSPKIKIEVLDVLANGVHLYW